MKLIWMSDPHFQNVGTIAGLDPRARLDAALERLDAECDVLLSQASDVGGSAPNPSDELTTLMEAFRLLARQESFHARLYAAVASGLTAEAAIWRTTDEAQKRLARLADPYLRERASDYQELRRRLLAALQGKRRRAYRRFQRDLSLLPSRWDLRSYWKWLPSSAPLGWCLKKAALRLM